MKATRVVDLLIERIANTYTRDEAQQTGIYYWPEPLPTPNIQVPDPLVLFQPQEWSEQEHTRTLIPLSYMDFLQYRHNEVQKPSLQIPLGLIDKPEAQLQETLLVDLHGSNGALSGGPLLLLGTHNSGKGTALQTIIHWLTARYTPQQFKCIAIDPQRDLDIFQHLPHFYTNQGEPLYTEGHKDEEIIHLTQLVTTFIQQRQHSYAQQRWHHETLTQLWSQGEQIPLVLVILSHYQRFTDRTIVAQALKKLSLLLAEVRTLGFYLIVTSTESSMRYLPVDLLSKVGTRISLFISEQQRVDMFGRIYPMDLVPGRGLFLTQEREIHQIQLALPIHGHSESERYEQLKQLIQKG